MDHQIKINELTTFYKFHASDNAYFIILHGWGGASDTWKEFLEILKENKLGYIMPDLPGFGKSSLPQKPWEVSDYAQFIEIFINQAIEQHNIPINNLYLIIHSFGGRIALKLNYLNIPPLKRIFWCASAGIKHPLTIKQKLLQSGSKIFQPLNKIPLFKKIVYKIAGSSDYINTSGIMKETFIKIINEDLTSYISKITTPSTIIWGDKDSYTPISDAHIFAQNIKGSKLIILSDITHGIHLKAPYKLYETIKHNL